MTKLFALAGWSTRWITSTHSVKEKNGLQVLLNCLLCRPEELLAKLHSKVRARSYVVQIGLPSENI